MGTKWQMVRVLRMGMRTVESQYSQTRFMGRRGFSLPYKAVFEDNEGTRVESRLSKLDQTIQKNEKLIKPVYTSPSGQLPKPDKFYPKQTNRDVKIKKHSPFSKKDLKHTAVVEEETTSSGISLKDIENEEDEDDDEMMKSGFHIPHYTKIHAWDKGNKKVKELGRLLTTNQRDRNVVVLEGYRLINDALLSGLQPSMLLFSRVKLLRDIETSSLGSDCECFHIPYDNIKLWSDLKTPPGLMAAFDKQQLISSITPFHALPITLVCDNVRSPDNLGAILRVAAGAGVERVLLTRGCVDPWSNKVLRAAAGAHFLVSIVERVGWENIHDQVPSYPHVVIADNVSTPPSSFDKEERIKHLGELETRGIEEGGFHISSSENGTPVSSYLDPKLTSEYKRIELDTYQYTEFNLNPGCREVVVIVGGETEGVSDAAYMFCHKFNGSRLYIPLRNKLNCLNVVSATSVLLFTVQQNLMKILENKQDSSR